MQRKWMIVAGLATVAGVAASALAPGVHKRFGGQINALGVALDEPAAYVATPSLTALSRDLVKAPVLRALLTEDFAFYYEAHEDRLGLAGALKRVAFEHETTWRDDLIALALDQPSEVALWTDARGAARHWALAMTRDALARVIQGLGPAADSDAQLGLIADVPLATFALETVAVYALQLSPRRTLAIASRGNRVVVLSDPGLLFDAARKPDKYAAKVLGHLLSGEARDQGLWRRHFGLPEQTGPGHTLVAGGELLALGYQQFFPALQALRVDVAPAGGALNTWVRQGSDWPASPWAALPAQAAACAALPVNWMQARQVLSGPDGKPKAVPVEVSGAKSDMGPALAEMARSFDGPAAICWYAGSQLHTPLLVAHAGGPAPSAKTLEAFMQWWLPSRAAWVPGDKTAAVNAPYGGRHHGENAGYEVAFRRAGNWWLFSPDAALVTRAEDAIARRYPSVADTLGAGARTAIATAAPAQIAELMRREALAVLSPDQANFRQAAETLLFPLLASFGKLPATQALPAGARDPQGWTALRWQPVATAP
jgi:uncharacterized protein YfaA (DUF2138 family)